MRLLMSKGSSTFFQALCATEDKEPECDSGATHPHFSAQGSLISPSSRVLSKTEDVIPFGYTFEQCLQTECLTHGVLSERDLLMDLLTCAQASSLAGVVHGGKDLPG
jgi:hypothetical protein